MKLPKDQLRMNKFEGLLVRYPMHSDGYKKLYWTIEHHADVSLGGYEVEVRGKSTIFFKLKEAVDFYNQN